MSKDAEQHSPPEKSSQDSHPLYPQTQARPTNEIGISEGADLYGDLTTAEGYGYVTRGYDAVPHRRRPTADGERPA